MLGKIRWLVSRVYSWATQVNEKPPTLREWNYALMTMPRTYRAYQKGIISDKELACLVRTEMRRAA